ncbi:PIG-L family deacetylase [Streptomyces sp. NPDC058953]|uniref:PIG-L family deacetylase n=1 Tax=unclassified Streptomyces TaxID=2593676 RepID=UPI00367B787B
MAVPSTPTPEANRPRRRTVVAALTALAGIGAGASACTVPPAPVSVPTADPAPGMPIAGTRRALLMQILAHPDDDLYFMNPDTQQTLAAGTPLVCVYITAGEHNGVNRIPGDEEPPVADRPGYSSARHQGLRQAYATLLGVDKFTPWTRDVVTLSGGRRAEINTLAHAGRRVELIFLNLPMHTRRRRNALPGLWKDRGGIGVQTVVAKDSPLRHSSPYTYHGLIDVLVGLMERYRPTVVQTLDPDPDIQHSDERTRRKDSEQPGYSDHGDHTAAACFSWAAMIRWVRDATERDGRVPGFVATAFRGYYNRHWPKNLPPEVLRTKASHLVPYGGDPEWECGNPSGCGDYAVGGVRPLRNRKGWVRSTHHRYPGPRPVAVADRDGRIAAYGVLGLRVVRWRETAPGSRAWEDPVDLGGGPLAPALGHTVLPDGRLLLFGLRFAAIGGRHAENRRELVLLEQRTPGGGFHAWRGLGAPERTADRSRRIGVPTAVTGGDGRVHLFVRNAGKGVSTRVRAGDGTWGRWRDLGGDAEIQDGLSAVTDGRGLVHVFAAAREGVGHWSQERTGGPVAFRADGGALPTPGDEVTAVPLPDGRIELYYRRPASGRLISVTLGGATAGAGAPTTAGRTAPPVRAVTAMEGYGPVGAASVAGARILVGRDLRGRIQLTGRTGGVRRPGALDSPALVVAGETVTAVGLDAAARPWLMRPVGRSPVLADKG